MATKLGMYEKLLKVQEEIGAIPKNAENPFYKSKYFDINFLLDIVKPVLTKNRIVLLQPLTNINGVSALRTILKDVDSDDTISYDIPLPHNDDPQKMGGIITYFRRYGLQSILSLSAEDDDGNYASGKTNYVQPKQNTNSTSVPQAKESKAQNIGRAIDELPPGTQAKVKELYNIADSEDPTVKDVFENEWGRAKAYNSKKSGLNIQLIEDLDNAQIDRLYEIVTDKVKSFKGGKLF